MQLKAKPNLAPTHASIYIVISCYCSFCTQTAACLSLPATSRLYIVVSQQTLKQCWQTSNNVASYLHYRGISTYVLWLYLDVVSCGLCWSYTGALLCMCMPTWTTMCLFVEVFSVAFSAVCGQLEWTQCHATFISWQAMGRNDRGREWEEPFCCNKQQCCWTLGKTGDSDEAYKHHRFASLNF